MVYSEAVNRRVTDNHNLCLINIVMTFADRSYLFTKWPIRNWAENEVTEIRSMLFLNCAALRRKNKDWLARNQNNSPSGATCLPADCCFSELAPYKSNLECWSSTKRTSCHDNCSFGFRQEKWRVSDCCLTPIQQFFSHIMTRTSSFSVRWWWWGSLCTRPTL
jgi:hypothetical protein